MKIFRKKEIIAAVLVVLIGCAGYLNWSYQDTINVTDNESYVETGKKLGEAQYVNSDVEVEDSSASMAPQATSKTDSEMSEAEKNEDEAEQTASDGAASEIMEDTNGTYFETAKYERENSRSKSMEILNQTASNESFDSETRKKAGDKIIAEAENIEKEQEIESIAQSKGYSEVCAYVNGEKINIMVRKENFGQEDVIKLTEIATDHLGIPASNVKIIEVK